MHQNKNKRRNIVWPNLLDYLQDLTPEAKPLWKCGALGFAKLPKKAKYPYKKEDGMQAYNVGCYVARMSLRLWHPMTWKLLGTAFAHSTMKAYQLWKATLKQELHDGRNVLVMIRKPLKVDKRCER